MVKFYSFRYIFKSPKINCIIPYVFYFFLKVLSWDFVCMSIKIVSAISQQRIPCISRTAHKKYNIILLFQYNNFD